MAFDCKASNFAMNTSTGNQSITGVGFQPKVVLFIPTRMTADGVQNSASWSFGVGVSSTNRRSITLNDKNAVGTSDTVRGQDNTECILMANLGATSVDYHADFVSLDADGFTINVSTAPSSAVRVGYIALGGADLTNVATGQFNGKTSTGTQATTGVGFQPDAIIFFGSMDTVQQIRTHAKCFLGFGVSSTKRAYLIQGSRDNQGTSDSFRYQRTNKIIGNVNDSGTINGEADLVSFDSDGFTLNYTTAYSVAENIHYIAFKGGQYDVGSFLTQASTGNFSKTGVGFQPSGLLMTSFMNAADSTKRDSMKISTGVASSSTSRFTTGMSSQDGETTTDTDEFSDDAVVYLRYNFNQVFQSKIDFVSFDSDGFTLDQINVDPTPNQIIYFTFGNRLGLPERSYPRGQNRGTLRGVI